MAKIKYNPVLAFLIMTAMVLLMYGNKASAASCTVTPAHVAGVLTLKISRYGQNYPINRGDFRLKATRQFGVSNCADGQVASGSTMRFRGPQQLAQTTDSQGYEAWILPGGQELPFLAVEAFVNPVNDGYFTQEAPTIKLDLNDVVDMQFGGSYLYSKNAGVDIVSFSNWKFPAGDESGSVIYSIGQAVGQISLGLIGSGSTTVISGYTPFYDAVIFDSLTINYTLSSCGIYSKASVVDFGDMYKIDIIHGVAMKKPFAVSLICGDESAPPSPVNITFSATNGFNDTTKGIVNTNLAGLGLQLSWQNSALPPLVLDQVNHSTLSGIGDYSVLAKPVTTLADNVFSAGKLDTSVTMNVEFQ